MALEYAPHNSSDGVFFYVTFQQAECQRFIIYNRTFYNHGSIFLLVSGIFIVSMELYSFLIRTYLLMPFIMSGIQ